MLLDRFLESMMHRLEAIINNDSAGEEKRPVKWVDYRGIIVFFEN